MSKGFVRVVHAKSVVVIETGRQTDEQFKRVKRVLGETFGSIMVNQLSSTKIEVVWYTSSTPIRLFSRKKPMTPERMREIVTQQLEHYADAIDYEFVKPRY